MNLSELQRPLAGSLNGQDQQFSCVTTDSRQVPPQSLFVALRGPNFDGHDHIANAISKGAIGAVVDRSVDHNDDQGISQIRVDDTLLAYGQIAGLNRQKFNKPLLALTGSAGKTSVKEMLASVLSVEGTVLSTQANFNNEIGVPRTLLKISVNDDFALLEMGASKVGDIAYLTQFCQPDVALVTNVHPAHIEGFGSLDNVAKTKGEIFADLKESGTAIINHDDTYSALWRELSVGKKVLSFSLEDPGASVYASAVKAKEWSSSFCIHTPAGDIDIELPIPGKHNILNALAVSAGALAMGASLHSIQLGLQHFSGVAGRLQMLPGIAGCRVIDDSYNANPGSVKSAIDVLAGFHCRTTLILGDMAELGEHATAMHKDVAEYARDCKINQLLAVGSNAEVMVSAFAGQGQSFASQDELIRYCEESIIEQEVLLIKGSRSAGMERIVKRLSLRPEMQSENRGGAR